MMSYALIGGLVGLAFAVVEYFVFGSLLRRAQARNAQGAGPRIIDLMRKVQIILFPVIGFVVGSLLAGDNGAS